MLKFWPHAPSDQVTPKASANPQPNPFDSQPLQKADSSQRLHNGLNSTAGGSQQLPRSESTTSLSGSRGGFKTPTLGEFPSGVQAGGGVTHQTQHGGFGPGSIGARLPLTPGPSATTSLSIAPPNLDTQLASPPSLRRAPSALSTTSPLAFNLVLPPNPRFPTASTITSTNSTSTTPPSQLNISDTIPSTPTGDGSLLPGGIPTGVQTPLAQGYSPNVPPKGHLTIKLLSARGLLAGYKKPYIVASFEQNEYVSREPLQPGEKREELEKGTAVNIGNSAPHTPGGVIGGSGGLGFGSISRAFDLAARSRTKTKLTLPTGKGGTPAAAATPITDDMKKEERKDVSDVGEVEWKCEVTFDLISTTSLLYLTVYDREPINGGEGFLGMRAIKPVLKNGFGVEQWFRLEGRGDEDEGDIPGFTNGAGGEKGRLNGKGMDRGSVKIGIRFDLASSKKHLTPKDFEFLKLIGRGTFGRVFQVRKRDTKRIYAMKVLSKKEIVAKKEVEHTIGERKILKTSLECPFLVGLKFSFQTEKQLYFVTDFKGGGELFWHLQKEGRFTEERARFYIAELVLALEHLHKYGIVYRDLKPENILLDATGHVALCDFGLSKPDLGADQLTNTFCGTTEYLAPEVLLDDNGYSKLVDFWSLGVLLFEMCCGWSPFYAEDTQQMYKNICFGKIRFPKGVIGDDGKQFVKQLLNRNPQHRLGATRDAEELKQHAFFKSIDWVQLGKKQLTPPFKPLVPSDESTANFDPEFTEASVMGANPFEEDDPEEGWVNKKSDGPSKSNGMSIGNSGNGHAGGAHYMGRGVNISSGSPLTSSVQENFRGFTYSGESMSLMGSSLVDASLGNYDEDEDEVLEPEEDALDTEDYDEDAEDGDQEMMDDGEGENDNGMGMSGIIRRTSDIQMRD